jgi:hypothetical protein
MASGTTIKASKADKKIMKNLCFPIILTSYAPRHSWALLGMDLMSNKHAIVV